MLWRWSEAVTPRPERYCCAPEARPRAQRPRYLRTRISAHPTTRTSFDISNEPNDLVSTLTSRPLALSYKEPACDRRTSHRPRPGPRGPRRPGEPALATLGLAAPHGNPADSSPHTFPDGGTWRTEIPSVEGPEALAVVLKESSRLDVPVHRVSQGSGVWMLSDAEITEMVEGCAERDIELCLFTGPRGTWDTGASARSDSGGAGLRARGHDALAGCVEDALRAAELGVRCLLVADEGVLWSLHRMRERACCPPTPHSRSPR